MHFQDQVFSCSNQYTIQRKAFILEINKQIKGLKWHIFYMYVMNKSACTFFKNENKACNCLQFPFNSM